MIHSKTWDYVHSLGIHFYELNDPKLESGNIICKPTKKLYSDHNVFEESEPNRHDNVVCTIFKCNAEFETFVELEIHQKTKHSNVCITCKAVLPSHHLLDLHILETHDVYFDLLAKNKPLYACLSEFCDKVFENAVKRKEHCISTHKFPSDFRFALQWRKKKASKITTKTEPKKYKNKIPKASTSMDCGNEACQVTKDDNRQMASNKGATEADPDMMELDTLPPKSMKVGGRSAVPKVFSFGMGVPRAFVNKNARKQNSTRKHIEDITMKDINVALEEVKQTI